MPIPPLSEERRLEMVKKAKKAGEECKVKIRSIRKKTNEEVRSMTEEGVSKDNKKDMEIEVQDITNKYIKRVDTIVEERSKDIMKV